jgi:dTDP-4-dehydrorhamnose reductase
MKIVLFGKTGQVGRALQSALAPLGQVIAPDRPEHGAGLTTASTKVASPNGLWQADLLDPAQLFERTLALSPDVIVNAAAYTAVDEAEHNQATAMVANAEAPAALARAAAQCGALLIHYSTDYVFDGTGTRPWIEADVARPINIYGHSKLAADQAIMHSGCRHLIFRTSWVYGRQGRGFLQQMMQLAMHRHCLRVVNDQIGAPTSACLIADMTAMAIDKYRSHPAAIEDGLYHLAASGQTSWFDYACHIFARMRANGLDLALDRVVPVSTLEYGSPARRPLSSRLDTGKLSGAFGLSLPGWQQGVDATVDALCEGSKDGHFLS